MRGPVRFQAGIERLEEMGYEVLVEVGPKPMLVGMGQACVGGGEAEWLASCGGDGGERQQLLESLGVL